MKPTFRGAPAPGSAPPASPVDEQDASVRPARVTARIVCLPRILPTSVDTAEAHGSAVAAHDQRHDLLLVLRPGNQLPDRTAAAHDHGPVRNLHHVIHRV